MTNLRVRNKLPKMDKKQRRSYLAVWMLVGSMLMVVLLLQLIRFSSKRNTKSVCNFKVCIGKFLDGPPQKDDVIISRHLRRNFFTAPSGKHYKLANVNENLNDTSYKLMRQHVNNIFANKKSGKFVVLGAGDGEFKDLTLDMERDGDWTGLLVEPNPELVRRMKTKRRNVEIAQLCVSPVAYPYKSRFVYPPVQDNDPEYDKILHYRQGKNSIFIDNKVNKTNLYGHFIAQCVPLASILHASRVIEDKIDLLVLDMSGKDDEILKPVDRHAFPDTQAAVVILNRGTPTDFIQTILQECCSLLLNQITLTRHEESETRLFFERVQERKLGL